MEKYFLALACLCFLGCSTRPASRPDRTSVPAVRSFEPSLLKPSHRRNCAIHIVREPGVSGSRLNLYLDGDQIARISAGEAMTVYVKPGRHLLSVRPLFNPVAKRRLFLHKGEATTIRIIDREGNFELKPARRALVL